MSSARRSPMFFVVWGLVLLLVILHQDNWFWDNGTLVFGFMPVALLYHACISIGAGITWFLATRFAWPEYLADDDLAHAEAARGTQGGTDSQQGTDSQRGTVA